MNKLAIELTAVASLACVDVAAVSSEIAEESKQPTQLYASSPLNVDAKTEGYEKIPSFSELKQQYAKYDELEAKKNDLLIKVKNRLQELKDQVQELSERNQILQRENASLHGQIQKLQDNALDNDNLARVLNIKLMNLEQEKEELLQKLFHHQMNIQEVKTISLELNSLLNQIPAEDEITKDCIKLLQDMHEINQRIEQILQTAESVKKSSNNNYQIEEIIKELNSTQELVQKKVAFYKNHELKLMGLCNKEKNKLPQRLELLKTQLNVEQKKYPELENLKLEENLMNSINTIKTFRQNTSAEHAEKIKSLEKILHEYVGLKIKESDLHRLEKKTKDFSDNIAKIEIMSSDFIKKNDKLAILKNEALQTIENAKIANDN